MHRSSRVHDVADQAMERVAPAIDEAKERLGPYVEDARTHANKTLIPAAKSTADDARRTYDKKVAPAAKSAAKDARRTYDKKVAPQVSAALASAASASEPYREEARRRGAATLAAARGEVEAPKKSHKLRNLILLLGLGGLVFAAVRYFKDDSDAWQSDYPAGPTAVPDPSDPVSAAEGPVADDAAAASPDVARADAGEHPHRPTDPDNPLERRDL